MSNLLVDIGFEGTKQKTEENLFQLQRPPLPEDLQLKSKLNVEDLELAEIDRDIQTIASQNMDKNELSKPWVEGQQQVNIYHITKKLEKYAIKIATKRKAFDADVYEKMRKATQKDIVYGDFATCKPNGGKMFMIAMDGTRSCYEGLLSTIKMMDAKKDHLIILTVRKLMRFDWDIEYDKDQIILLNYQVWRAAVDGIIKVVDKKLASANISYTALVPPGSSAKQTTCDLVKEFKVNVLVVAAHKKGESAHGWFSSSFCGSVKSGVENCDVIVY